MQIDLPEDALVLLVGPSGSGKSTFALRHFSRTVVVSSDFCRALVSDDETNMDATAAAFRILHAIVRERLRAGRLTVVDATNVREDKRRRLLKNARERIRPAVAIVFDFSDATYLERNRARPDRSIPESAVKQQVRHHRTGLPNLEAEGFARVYRFGAPDEVDNAVIRIGTDVLA